MNQIWLNKYRFSQSRTEIWFDKVLLTTDSMTESSFHHSLGLAVAKDNKSWRKTIMGPNIVIKRLKKKNKKTEHWRAFAVLNAMPHNEETAAKGPSKGPTLRLTISTLEISKETITIVNPFMWVTN